MAYHKPSADHPWKRSYKAEQEVKEVKTNYKSVKTFICEIAESYSNIEIYTGTSARRHYLEELPQSKQASWLVNMLRKYYQSF